MSRIASPEHMATLIGGMRRYLADLERLYADGHELAFSGAAGSDAKVKVGWTDPTGELATDPGTIGLRDALRAVSTATADAAGILKHALWGRDEDGDPVGLGLVMRQGARSRGDMVPGSKVFAEADVDALNHPAAVRRRREEAERFEREQRMSAADPIAWRAAPRRGQISSAEGWRRESQEAVG